MQDKVALITGGTRGIGLGIGKVLLANGYKVALVYRSDIENALAVSEKLASDNLLCIQADITSKLEREKLLDEVEKSFGTCSFLINNAGIIRMGRLLDIREDDYRKVMECNLHAPIFLAQSFCKRLVERKQKGAIVNILSIGAYRGGNLAYCASKAALLTATKSMACELAKYDIRVNSVSPFGVVTELNKKNRDENPQAWDKMLNKAAMKRASTPEEIASAVLYLVSPEASYVTGIDIPVDGGYLAK